MKLTSLVKMNSESSESDNYEEIVDTSPSEAVQNWINDAPSTLASPESVRSTKLVCETLSKSESVFQILDAYKRKDYSGTRDTLDGVSL